jgi:hypothetical protein
VLHAAALDPVGFLQFFNSWKSHTCIRQLACGPVLSKAAAALLGCDQIRLYQVCSGVPSRFAMCLLPQHASTRSAAALIMGFVAHVLNVVPELHVHNK